MGTRPTTDSRAWLPATGAALAVAAMLAVACSGGGTATVDPARDTAASEAVTSASEVVTSADVPSSTPSETTPAFVESDVTVDIAVIGAATWGVAKPGFHRFTFASGLVRTDDGVLHAFRNSFAGSPGEVTIDRVQSTDDGATWTVEEPAFDQLDVVEETTTSVFGNTVLPLDEGGFAMWVTTFAGIDRPGVILRATAPDITGPWTFDEQPAIEPGPAGSWDGISVNTARVVRDDGWHLWYGGVESRRGFGIGYATSDDGVTWSKHDDPATTDRRLNPSDPITVGEQEWRPGQLTNHEVVRVGDQWVMFYSGLDSIRERGVAVSDDGVTWAPATQNPVYTTDDVAPDQGRVLGGISLLADGDDFLALLGSGSRQETLVYPARVSVRVAAEG